MKKQTVLLWILVMALVFSFAIISCEPEPDPPDTWKAATSLSQLNGSWKGSGSVTMKVQDMFGSNESPEEGEGGEGGGGPLESLKANIIPAKDQENEDPFADLEVNVTMAISADWTISASAKTLKGTMTETLTFSGRDSAAFWDAFKEYLDGEGVTLNDSKKSATYTELLDGSIDDDYYEDWEINQNGKKIRTVFYEDETTGKKSYLTLTKK